MNNINTIGDDGHTQVFQLEKSNSCGPETNALLHELMLREETELRGSGKDVKAFAFQLNDGPKWVEIEDYCGGHAIVSIWLDELNADAWTCVAVREKGQKKDRYVCIFYCDGETYMTQPNTDEHMTLVDALIYLKSKSQMT